MKFSAFAVFPSRIGRVVNSANKITGSFFLTIFAKRTIEINEATAKNTLNQTKLPARAAIK